MISRLSASQFIYGFISVLFDLPSLKELSRDLLAALILQSVLGVMKVLLHNKELWEKFREHQTEMMVTKEGRYVSSSTHSQRLLRHNTYCY